MTQPTLEVRGVSKSYVGIKALSDVSVSFAPGSVHALLGENGAGKSTLTKVICGAVSPDAGEIVVAGKPAGRLTPRRAGDLGINVIPQERQIAFALTITENVLLGQLPVRRGRVDWKSAHSEAARRLEQIGLDDIDVRASVNELTVGELQMVEIARALTGDLRVLLLDEPTSVLAGKAIDRLFDVIRRLRSRGTTIIYISHHLDEVTEIADEITVLRDGFQIHTSGMHEVNHDTMVELITGEDVTAQIKTVASLADRVGECVIEADKVTVGVRLKDVSLSVRSGEVVCVIGGVGSGRRELARALAGVEKPDRGTVTVKGKRLRGRTDAIGQGVAFVPEDRKREGLMLSHTVADNIGMGVLAGGSGVMIRPSSVRKVSDEKIKELRIKTPSNRTIASHLSGGNQQKVVLARCLASGADVFVLDEPTAGIDIGAKAEIHRMLQGLAAEGSTVVIFSADREEIKDNADRVLVLRRGEIVAELERSEITDERLVALGVNRRGEQQSA